MQKTSIGDARGAAQIYNKFNQWTKPEKKWFYDTGFNSIPG
jgi:hypothetical protein